MAWQVSIPKEKFLAVLPWLIVFPIESVAACVHMSIAMLNVLYRD